MFGKKLRNLEESLKLHIKKQLGIVQAKAESDDSILADRITHMVDGFQAQMTGAHEALEREIDQLRDQVAALTEKVAPVVATDVTEAAEAEVEHLVAP